MLQDFDEIFWIVPIADASQPICDLGIKVYTQCPFQCCGEKQQLFPHTCISYMYFLLRCTNHKIRIAFPGGNWLYIHLRKQQTLLNRNNVTVIYEIRLRASGSGFTRWEIDQHMKDMQSSHLSLFFRFI